MQDASLKVPQRRENWDSRLGESQPRNATVRICCKMQFNEQFFVPKLRK